VNCISLASSDEIEKGFRREPGYHSFQTSNLIENAHRDVLRVAFWMHLLYDSVGVRTVQDLDILEPWMLLKGIVYRDADSVMQVKNVKEFTYNKNKFVQLMTFNPPPFYFELPKISI